MIEFPYGIADFRSLRQQGLLYVDRTAYISRLERLGRALVFLRPRRFGKSLWLQTLANYYDLRRKDEFETLFGDLCVGRAPTPLAHRYFVLQWNFSVVSASGSLERIAESLREHVQVQAEVFVSDYEGILPGAPDLTGSPAAVLARLLAAVRKTPYKLYLLIDEYDHLLNEVMANDVETYRALFARAGPFKEIFKAVKNALEGQGLERVFLTGVAPVALNDLTSGFNVAKNVSLDPDLGSLCGFKEEELRDLLTPLVEAGKLPPEDVSETMDTMRTWYNGYRFTPGSPREAPREGESLVYNPTNVLYFLDHLHRWGTPPRQLQDENLRTDVAKLRFLAHLTGRPGNGGSPRALTPENVARRVIADLAEGSGEIRLPRLQSSFSVDDLLQRMTQDRSALASFLYYLGLLTLASVDPVRLKVPNLVVRKLFLDRWLEIHLPDLRRGVEARDVAAAFLASGDLGPLLAFLKSISCRCSRIGIAARRRKVPVRAAAASTRW